jgi:LacI family transcriptional regulator
MAQQSRVTQKQIAERLGLSTATVSRALKDDPRISAETTAQVKEAARDLGYHRGPRSRPARPDARGTVGLVVADVSQPFYGELARGVKAQLHEQEFDLIICDSDGSPWREAGYVELLCALRVSGLLVTPLTSDAAARQQCRPAGVPYVLIDAQQMPNGASTVSVDHVEGASLAVRHLIELGHVRIGFVGGALTLPPVQMMFRGFRRALSEVGLRFESEWICQETPDSEGGYRAVRKLLAGSNPPTAALFVSDLMAIAALAALGDAGLQVPEDFSVVGYDDIPMAAIVEPPLTTVAQDKFGLGRISSRILIHEIETGPGVIHQKALLQPKLILRGSTGPPER